MTVEPLLVLSCEGLATTALGCYGSSWNQTPTIDRLAATGCVWDRWVKTTDDRLEPVAGLFKSDTDWLAAWKQHGTTQLITDQAAIANAAEKFDSIIQVDQHAGHSSGSSQAMEIEQTAMASLMAQAIDRDASTQGDWSLMWIHSSVLTRCWDAPRSLFPIDDIETQWLDEPSETEQQMNQPVPDAIDPIFSDTVPPQLQLAADQMHCDLVTSWMRTYGCQVRLLDLMIDILRQSLQRPDARVMLFGTSGMSLGQNGWIGHHVGPLRSQDVRVPMILSDAGPIRMPQLASDHQLESILRSVASNDHAWCNPEVWCGRETSSVVHTQSGRVHRAVTTPDWFFVHDAVADLAECLFLKPDDVEDFNNVARLRPDVVNKLSDDP